MLSRTARPKSHTRRCPSEPGRRAWQNWQWRLRQSRRHSRVERVAPARQVVVEQWRPSPRPLLCPCGQRLWGPGHPRTSTGLLLSWESWSFVVTSVVESSDSASATPPSGAYLSISRQRSLTERLSVSSGSGSWAGIRPSKTRQMADLPIWFSLTYWSMSSSDNGCFWSLDLRSSISPCRAVGAMTKKKKKKKNGLPKSHVDWVACIYDCVCTYPDISEYPDVSAEDKLMPSVYAKTIQV